MKQNERNLAPTVRARRPKRKPAAVEPGLPNAMKIRWVCPQCSYTFWSFHRSVWVYSQPGCIDCLFHHGQVVLLDPIERQVHHSEGV